MKINRITISTLVFVAFLVVIAPAPVAHAATITVNSTAGTKVTDGACTLREAIENANNNAATWPDCAGGSGADIITLPTAATIMLTVADNGSAQSAAGLPQITSDITINGNNSIIERSSAGGTPYFRIFYIGATPSYNLTLNNVTVRNGRAGDAPSPGQGGGYGGGIANFGGALTVNNSTISGNRTGNGDWDGDGGGIYSNGQLTVTNSTISSNSTDAGNGAGIEVLNFTANITNTTIVGNSHVAGYGGAINVSSGAIVTITNSTIAFNTAGTGTGGGISKPSGTVTLKNTIVANNTASSGANCSGTILNGGNNLDSGTSCGWFSTNGSMSNTDPKLGLLVNLGGPTKVLGLLSGSLAINGVTYSAPNGCPATDQRGVARPIGATCDIGAFEGTTWPLFLPLIVK